MLRFLYQRLVIPGLKFLVIPALKYLARHHLAVLALVIAGLTLIQPKFLSWFFPGEPEFEVQFPFDPYKTDDLASSVQWKIHNSGTAPGRFDDSFQKCRYENPRVEPLVQVYLRVGRDNGLISPGSSALVTFNIFEHYDRSTLETIGLGWSYISDRRFGDITIKAAEIVEGAGSETYQRWGGKVPYEQLNIGRHIFSRSFLNIVCSLRYSSGNDEEEKVISVKLSSRLWTLSRNYYAFRDETGFVSHTSEPGWSDWDTGSYSDDPLDLM